MIEDDAGVIGWIAEARPFALRFYISRTPNHSLGRGADVATNVRRLGAFVFARRLAT